MADKRIRIPASPPVSSPVLSDRAHVRRPLSKYLQAFSATGDRYVPQPLFQKAEWRGRAPTGSGAPRTSWSVEWARRMGDPDALVRLAAFRFLEEQVRLAPEDGALSRDALTRGFTYEGQRVPLMGPQGIFKPRLLREIPLSITSVPIIEGETRPYDDAFGPDGLLRYRYRGTNPAHHENVGLRLAMQRQVPLIYFHGVVPGLYVAEWPVYIVGDDSGRLTFTVSVEERRFASLGSMPPEFEETEIRRRYVTRAFRQRLHQREFRERVVHAYQHHCAVCRLRRNELLEAAHIVADADPLGVPSVPNGIALCTLHHAAFDRDVIGITPDYIVEVRPDVLRETDGPMLIHGLQGFNGQSLRVPSRDGWKPDRRLLEARYARFRRLAG